jgi:hypothetical protein
MEQEEFKMVDEVIYFNGIFNNMMMGLPVYVWLFLFLLLTLVLSNVFWYMYFWNPITPFKGLFNAYKKGIDSALIGDINNNLNLVSESKAKLIFDEKIKEAKEGERDWKDTTSGQIGVVGTDIITDLSNWTKPESEEHIAVAEAADKWNMDHPDDQIHSFNKFINYAKDNKLEVMTPIFVVIDWIRIESAFPKSRLKSFFAGYVRQLAEKMDDAEQNKLNQMGYYILLGSIGLSALMIIGKFILHKPV